MADQHTDLCCCHGVPQVTTGDVQPCVLAGFSDGSPWTPHLQLFDFTCSPLVKICSHSMTLRGFLEQAAQASTTPMH